MVKKSLQILSDCKATIKAITLNLFKVNMNEMLHKL